MARREIITDGLDEIAAKANPSFTKDEINEMQACVKIARPDEYYFVNPLLALKQRKEDIKKLRESSDKRDKLKYRYIKKLLKLNDCDIIYELDLEDERNIRLYNLKIALDKALNKCQDVINRHPNAVLSEADLERLLCNSIEKVLKIKIDEEPKRNQFSVHTQISHYPNKKKAAKGQLPDMRPDILILDESKLEDAPDINKQFKYYNEAFSIELKYYHKYINVSSLDADIIKRKRLGRNTWLYIVVLVDTDNVQDFLMKESKIIDRIPKSKKMLYFRVMRKVTEHNAAANFKNLFK